MPASTTGKGLQYGWTLGENGKFVRVRGYYDPPAEVDAYFQMPS